MASYRDLGAFQLLLALQDDEALALYCESVLGPLEEGGGEYGDELIRSLEAFIEQNGQWERAARELFCHRHTLRYRIRKVEELTGRDLSSARDRIEFWLALRGTGAGGMSSSSAAGATSCGSPSWAGGIIAPAIVRDLAESEEVEHLLLLDLDEARARRPPRRTAARRPRSQAVDPRGGAGLRSSTASTCWSTRPATA